MQTDSYRWPIATIYRSLAYRALAAALVLLMVGCGEVEPAAVGGGETPLVAAVEVEPAATGMVHGDNAAVAKAPIDKLFTVYKNSGCQCCDHWVDHMELAGFSGTVIEMADITEIKQRYAIEPALQSCHTAVIDGYVFEGHIPASQVAKFLAQRPTDRRGLAVPGMPVGSPGMEMGDRHQPYDVVALNSDGSRERYAHIANKEAGL